MAHPVSRDPFETLIGSDAIAGTPVFHTDASRLGKIERVMLERKRGVIVYVVIRFRGFLGLGRRYRLLSWSRLSYDPALGGYRYDGSGSTLRRTPAGRGERPHNGRACADGAPADGSREIDQSQPNDLSKL